MPLWPVLFAIVACSDGELADDQTSVVLSLSNGAGVPVPDSVLLDIFQNGEPMLVTSVTKPVMVSGDGFLGDIVIFARPESVSLQFVASGSVDGVPVSSGELSVAVERRTQMEATIILLAETPLPTPDAGVSADAAPSMGGTGGSADGGGMGGSGGTGGSAPPGMLGELCSEAAGCESGHCVDGVCCNEACSDACRGCRVPGQTAGLCQPLAPGTSCGPASCAARDRILHFNACDGVGQCIARQIFCQQRMCNGEDPSNLVCR